MSSLPPRFINQIICGDACQVLKAFPEESIDCVVTSPPYWALRDYEANGQIGLETTFQEYLAKLLAVFGEAKRVLKATGTCWVNMGDTYANSMKGRGGPDATDIGDGVYARLQRRASFKPIKLKAGLPIKTLCQIPARFSIAMTEQGWILRNEIIWYKPNCMPSSAHDRFTIDFEKIFFFVKSRRYYFEQQFEKPKDRARLARRAINPLTPKKRIYGTGLTSAINPKTMEASRKRILEKGRNKRCVWRIATRPYFGNHFATYPPQLIEIPIKAGCPEGGIVLDPFIGSGTTALVAQGLGRKYIGIDLNPEYVRIAEKRLAQRTLF